MMKFNAGRLNDFAARGQATGATLRALIAAVNAATPVLGPWARGQLGNRGAGPCPQRLGPPGAVPGAPEIFTIVVVNI